MCCIVLGIDMSKYSAVHWFPRLSFTYIRKISKDHDRVHISNLILLKNSTMTRNYTGKLIVRPPLPNVLLS